MLYSEAASTLCELGLEHPPIALTIPGPALTTLASDLSQTLESNQKMLDRYQAKKDAFA